LSLVARGTVLVIEVCSEEVGNQEVGNEERGDQTNPALSVRIRVRWSSGEKAAEFSTAEPALAEPSLAEPFPVEPFPLEPCPDEQGLAEIGFLVAQATFERCGAAWQRERTENLETITLQMGKVRTAGEFAGEFE